MQSFPLPKLPSLSKGHGLIHIFSGWRGAGWVEVPAWVFTFAPLGIELFFHRPLKATGVRGSESYYLGKSGWHITDMVTGRLLVGYAITLPKTRSDAYYKLCNRLQDLTHADYNKAVFNALGVAAPRDVLLPLGKHPNEA